MCPESCRADHLQARKARLAVPAVVWQAADLQPGWSPPDGPKKERILAVVKQSAKVDESPAVLSACYCRFDGLYQWPNGGSLYAIVGLEKVDWGYYANNSIHEIVNVPRSRKSGTSSAVSRHFPRYPPTRKGMDAHIHTLHVPSMRTHGAAGVKNDDYSLTSSTQ